MVTRWRSDTSKLWTKTLLYSWEWDRALREGGHFHCILRLVSAPSKRNWTIWSKLAAMLSRFCQPLFYGIGAGGGTSWSTLLVSRWVSSTCWDSNPPLGSFTRKESHTDVEVLFGGILAWEFLDVFGGIFTHVWRPHNPALSFFFTVHFYTLLIATLSWSCCFCQFNLPFAVLTSD